MLHSLHFNRAFWLDDENNLCSAPCREDGTVDELAWHYVVNLPQLVSGQEIFNEELDFDKLLYIHRQLVLDKAGVVEATLPTGAGI